MKKIEKMAYEYSKGQFFEHVPRQILRQEAFESGFRAARQMSLDAIDKFDVDPVGRYWEYINSLGEEEV